MKILKFCLWAALVSCTTDPGVPYNNYLYDKGTSFIEVTGTDAGEVKLESGYLLSKKNRLADHTVSYTVHLPIYKRGIFFSRDDRPGDHKWPNTTNRLLPWSFTSISELASGEYPGIPSNGKPHLLGEALLLELADGSILFAKAVLGPNSVSRLQVNAHGGVQLVVSTLGTDALPRKRLPLAVVAQGTDVYGVVRKAFETLRSRGPYAPTPRAGKAYFEAFAHLGWCTWEHYRMDIDEEKILHDITLIENSPVPVRYILIDDGHLSSTQRRLTSFLPDSARFPNGWENIWARKSPDKIKWMGLWYALAGYWEGLDGEFEGTYPYRRTSLPGPDQESIRKYYHHFVTANSGFDFLKVDNQSYSLPLYMGGEGSVRKAIACNQALEEEMHAQGMGLMNCMAHNVVNTDNVKYSNSTRVSIDYQKYDLEMAKSHLYQSYQNTLLFGQSVWPDHDMFHSSDEICGEMMARSKAISGGPVYLSDHPSDFVVSRILPLCDARGRIFRPKAPAVPMPESVFGTVMDGSSPYRVFAPVGDEAMAVLCYNFGDSTVLQSGANAQDYSLRNGFETGQAAQADSVLVYDWTTGTYAVDSLPVELKGFSDRLLFLCPIVDGWAPIGIREKYLPPATFTLTERTPSKLTLEVLTPGTLVLWDNGTLRQFEIKEAGPCCIFPLTPTHSPSIPTPKPHQVKWHQAEMGAIFHYDLHVFDGIRYGQGNNRINPIEDYNTFNPQQLDTDQWVLAAKAAGCQFAVLTATHETGFGLWQSDVNPYCLKAVKWRDGKGDIVRDFVNSCRKYGIQPGIYVGIRWNSLLGIHNFQAEGEGKFAANRQAWYKRYCEKMVEELCTRYGELFLIWFDGGADDPRGLGPDVEPIVNKLQPNCLFYHNVDRADFRWGGSETGTVGYPCWSTFPVPCSHNKHLESEQSQQELLMHGHPEGKYWVPAMADTPLRGAHGRHEWFWEPDDESNILSLETLMDIYEKSVGRNATLILGLTPDPHGLIPEGDVLRLKEWGDALRRRFGKPMARTQGCKEVLTLELDRKQRVTSCIIQEDIALGERIRSYQVEAKINGEWTTLCTGESVGHKRIETFPPIETTAVRLSITAAVDTPQITDFSLY